MMTIPRVLATALLLGTAIGPIFAPLEARAQQQQAPAPAVVVAPATIADLRQSVDFTGRVVAIQKVDIRARVSGFLEAIHFTEGQQTTAGTVLYEVEDGSYRAAVEQIEGQIQSAEAERKLAELERNRRKELVQRQTISQAEFDRAEAELAKAEGELMRLQGSKEAADLELSYTKIVAPFDGILGLSKVDVGALVGPDSGSLVTLTRLDPINVEFPVATAMYLRYRELEARGEISGETNVHVILPDGTEYPVKGTINFVSSDVAQGTDTVTVRASFDNPDGVLFDGALVRVSLEDSEPEEVLTIPQQAVQRDQQGAFVMVVGADSTVEQRRVDVARTARGQAVISSGLQEGENVITDGVGKVRPGMTVDAAQATDS